MVNSGYLLECLICHCGLRIFLLFSFQSLQDIGKLSAAVGIASCKCDIRILLVYLLIGKVSVCDHNALESLQKFLWVFHFPRPLLYLLLIIAEIQIKVNFVICGVHHFDDRIRTKYLEKTNGIHSFFQDISTITGLFSDISHPSGDSILYG